MIHAFFPMLPLVMRLSTPLLGTPHLLGARAAHLTAGGAWDTRQREGTPRTSRCRWGRDRPARRLPGAQAWQLELGILSEGRQWRPGVGGLAARRAVHAEC